MARVTAKGLQIGAEARRLRAGALGLAGEGCDMPRMIGRGLRQGRSIGLGRAGGGGGVKARCVPLETPVPAHPAREQQRPGERQRQGVARQQDEQRAGHGYAARASSKCGPSGKEAQSPPQTRATPSSAAAAFMAAANCRASGQSQRTSPFSGTPSPSSSQ